MLPARFRAMLVLPKPFAGEAARILPRRMPGLWAPMRD
jgi:hypothetical protein